jgi:hypothetical protein
MKTDFFRSENCAVLTGHRGEAEIAAGELLPRRHCSIYAFSVNPCSSSVPRFVRRFVRHSSTHALIFKVSPALAGGRGAEPGFGWDSAEPGLVAAPDLAAAAAWQSAMNVFWFIPLARIAAWLVRQSSRQF